MTKSNPAGLIAIGIILTAFSLVDTNVVGYLIIRIIGIFLMIVGIIITLGHRKAVKN